MTDKPENFPIRFDSFKNAKAIEYIKPGIPGESSHQEYDMTLEYAEILHEIDSTFITLYAHLLQCGFSENMEKNMRVAFTLIEAGLDNELGISNGFQNYVEIIEKKLNGELIE